MHVGPEVSRRRPLRARSDGTSGAYLRYELFLDPGHAVPWDDERPLRGIAGVERSTRIKVYARLYGVGLSPEARYADAVDVRVDFY
jgi:spore coat protein U-like protein